jgi:hypothetical protein
MSLRGWLGFLAGGMWITGCWFPNLEGKPPKETLNVNAGHFMVDAANGHSLWPKTQFHLPPYLRVILRCIVSIQRVHISCPMQLHENQQRVRIPLELIC